MRIMVRRNLTDKAALLEITVTKYRSELAAATSNIAGKDILIGRLQRTVMENEEELSNRDKRIRQLEAKLSIAIQETHALNCSQLDMQAARSDTPSSTSRDYFNSSGPRYVDGQYQPRSSLYRRPSSMHGDNDEAGGALGMSKYSSPGGDSSPTDMRMSRHGPSRNGKRHSVTDNAISRLTISPPTADDKFGDAGGSSACVVQ